jgi:hypothetical protein
MMKLFHWQSGVWTVEREDHGTPKGLRQRLQDLIKEKLKVEEN